MKNATHEKFLHQNYFQIAVSVDCVIFGYEQKELKVLLIKSDMEEFKRLYSLLGDLVKIDEDLDTASYRVLTEKTGLKDVFLEQVQAFGSIYRHPSGRVITAAYYALIDIKSIELKVNSNELSWHSVYEINKLAFDHKQILQTSLHKLCSQVLIKPIIFNLLPKKFSLRQLQEVYEAILNIKLDRRNFRKKISLKGWIEDTNEIEKNKPHRPGKLYKLKNKSKSIGFTI